MFGWTLVRIDGPSMSPLLESGDFALIRKTGHGRAYRSGDTALVDHPAYGRMVKCLGNRDTDGRYQLFGISAASTDRASLGKVGPERLLGRLIIRIAPGKISLIRPQPFS